MQGFEDILQLGDWKGVRPFSKHAVQVLSDLDYRMDLEQLNHSVADWLLKTKPLPEQVNLHNTFGQPPVTLFNNGRFVVELYFWMGAETSLHSHGFQGAFRVLHGLSLHEVFDIRTREKISHDVELTEVAGHQMEILKPGDIREIAPGRGLSHRVIHLENPTITLCVKTIGEADLAQWHHFSNGLAIQRRHVPASLVKQIYYYQYLTGGELAAAYLDQLVGGLDRSMLMNLCEEIGGGALDLREDVVEEILRSVSVRFEGETWFELYQDALAALQEEADLSALDTARERLKTHFANQNLSENPQALSLLKQV